MQMYWNEVFQKYGKTKIGVATALGLTRGNICTLTAPKRDIKIATARNFCRAIGCSLKEVLFGEDYLTFHIINGKDYFFAHSYAELEELFGFIPVTDDTQIHLCYENRHYFDTKENILVKAKELEDANRESMD